MPASPTPKKYNFPSIQTVYNLHTGIEYKKGILALHCNNVIKIPIAEPVVWKFGIDTYTVTPYTALVIENAPKEMIDSVEIVIETNEGITVEPIVVYAPLVQFDMAYLLTLPRGTTGIKKAYIRGLDEYGFVIQNDLIFDVMEAPYNYENYLITLNYNEFVQFRDYVVDRIHNFEDDIYNLGTEVDNLKARVTALENKAGT